MSREEQVEKLTAYMANFIGYTAKVLPDDVIAKLDELAEREDGFLPAQIQNLRILRKSYQDRWFLQNTGFPAVHNSLSSPLFFSLKKYTFIWKKLPRRDRGSFHF